jgi:hypothetical protein
MSKQTPVPAARSRIQFSRILSCLLLPMLLLTAGCSSLVTDSQVPGTYQAETSWGTSTLVLSKDHTFDQTVRFNSGQTKHINGKWEIDRSSGTPVFFTIQFTPFLIVTHDKQGESVATTMASIYHVPFGLNIAADPEYGIAHRKQRAR